MKITADYPIVKDGFDLKNDIKYAKFKRRGDFTIVLEGKLEELASIECPLKSIMDKCDVQQIHCTKDIE